jgi:hypothetical protein
MKYEVKLKWNDGQDAKWFPVEAATEEAAGQAVRDEHRAKHPDAEVMRVKRVEHD